VPDDRDDGRGDRLAAAVAELYGAAPGAFTERRAELTAAARGAGDRAAAKAIGALRRPTRAAWVVNRLARADPSAPGKLAELAGALRAAQQARHGPRLRELSAARGALVDALTAQALALAGVADAPPSLRLEVSETLTAALADPGVAAAFAVGTLTRAVQWSGFGVLPAAGDADSAEDAAGSGAWVPGPGGQGTDGQGYADRGRASSRDGAGPPAAPTGTDTGRPVLTEVAKPRTRAGRAAPAGAEAVARRQAAEEERLAREAAERAARLREQYSEAERAVAAAAAAAAEAVSAEDGLEAEVRDLEQRLTQARAGLAAARMRARHAEAAERRARQAFDRLGG
jgi:hypothetical protein